MSKSLGSRKPRVSKIIGQSFDCAYLMDLQEPYHSHQTSHTKSLGPDRQLPSRILFPGLQRPGLGFASLNLTVDPDFHGWYSPCLDVYCTSGMVLTYVIVNTRHSDKHCSPPRLNHSPVSTAYLSSSTQDSILSPHLRSVESFFFATRTLDLYPRLIICHLDYYINLRLVLSAYYFT